MVWHMRTQCHRCVNWWGKSQPSAQSWNKSWSVQHLSQGCLTENFAWSPFCQNNSNNFWLISQSLMCSTTLEISCIHCHIICIWRKKCSTQNGAQCRASSCGSDTSRTHLWKWLSSVSASEEGCSGELLTHHHVWCNADACAMWRPCSSDRCMQLKHIWFWMTRHELWLSLSSSQLAHQFFTQKHRSSQQREDCVEGSWTSLKCHIWFWFIPSLWFSFANDSKGLQLLAQHKNDSLGLLLLFHEKVLMFSQIVDNTFACAHDEWFNVCC